MNTFTGPTLTAGSIFDFRAYMPHLPPNIRENLTPIINDAFAQNDITAAVKALGAQGVPAEYIPNALKTFLPNTDTTSQFLTPLTRPEHTLQILLGETITKIPYDTTLGILLKTAVARAKIRGIVDINASSYRTPISLGDVLTHPEKYKDNSPKVVLIDVDGTTRAGQGWMDWIGRIAFKVLFKKTTLEEQTGAEKEILKILIPSLKARIKEVREGHINREEVQKFIAETIKDMDPLKIGASLSHWHRLHGREGISEFLCDEIVRHYEAGHLVLLVSASPKPLIEDHARDLGLPPENVMGTSFTVDPQTQKLSGEMVYLHDVEKARALTRLSDLFKERGLKLETVAAYTDSPSDMDMLQFALDHANPERKNGITFAVNASKPQLLKWVQEHNGSIVHELAGYRTIKRSDPRHPGHFLITREQIENPLILPTIPQKAASLISEAVGLTSGAFAGSFLQQHTPGAPTHNTHETLRAAAAGILTSLLMSLSPQKETYQDSRSALGITAPLVATEIFLQPLNNPTALIATFALAAALPYVILAALQEIAYARGSGITGRVLRSQPTMAFTRASQLVAFQMIYHSLAPVLAYYLGNK